MFIVTKKINEDNIGKVCRTCLREDHGKMLYLFFGPAESSLGAKLQSLSCLEVYQGDGLPENMCDKCVSRTESALLFREQCRAADQALREAAYQVTQAKMHQLQNQNALPAVSQFSQSNNAEMIEEFPNYPSQQDQYLSNQYYPETYQREQTQNNAQTYPHIVEPSNSAFKRYENDYTNANDLGTGKDAYAYRQTEDINAQSTIRHSSMLYPETTWEMPSANYNYSTNSRAQLENYDMHNISDNANCEQIIANNDSYLQNQEEQTDDNSEENDEDSNHLTIDEERSVEQTMINSIDNMVYDKISSDYNSRLRENQSHFSNGVIEYNSSEVQQQSQPINELPQFQETPVISHTEFRGESSEQQPQHQQQQQPQKTTNRYKCETCSRLFCDITRLQTHQLLHRRKKPFECVHCGNRYLTKNKLAAHIRLHTKVNVHQCNICEKIFSYPSSLTEHMKTHEEKSVDKGVSYECAQCKKQFRLIQSYHRHMKFHTGKDLYHCDACDKLFASKYTLKIHMHSHEAVKVYPCELCDKAFNQKSNLVEHTRTHTKDKPYKCKLCDKSFAQTSHLKSHIICHNSVRKYKCKICDKTFKLSSHLKRHVNLHTGIKMHKCDKCDQVFTQAFSLKRHMKRHDPE
ncbi:hypothetical protein TKK_0005351 [Trichogramma kaykai]|uniref:Protein krueppel n=1 Tax=Trichogramma kaykai TaxID=54128 RepID=A0ABD2XIF7_9HYME